MNGDEHHLQLNVYDFTRECSLKTHFFFSFNEQIYQLSEDAQ